MRHAGDVSILVCLLIAYSTGNTVDRTGHAVWRIRAETDAALEHVMHLASVYELHEWNELHRPDRYVDVMVNLEMRDSFRLALRDAPGVTHSVFIADVEERIKRHVDRSKRDADASYNYAKFNSFEKIEKELQNIAKKNPDMVELTSIGQTGENRSIYLLKVSHNIKNAAKKPMVLIDAGIHAREWISVSTIMWLINEVVTNPEESGVLRGFLDSLDFVFMPVLNPDGYVYTWEHDRLWRKNRKANTNSECIGVDLNRNWDYMWGGEGTSDDPCKSDYRGTQSFSELETKAVRNWVETHKSQIVVYINFHSYGQLWMTPYGYSKNIPDNESEMMKYSQIAVEAISAYRGTSYTFGPVYTTIYPASSISVDWIRGQEKIKIAYTVELPDKGLHGFLVPEKEIMPVGKETWLGLRELLLSLGHKEKLFRTEEFMIV